VTRIEEIESRIRELNPDELSTLRRWFLEFDSHAWDRQIEEDAKNGRLDALADSAIRDHKSGRAVLVG
jgi:hypothetical protein